MKQGAVTGGEPGADRWGDREERTPLPDGGWIETVYSVLPFPLWLLEGNVWSRVASALLLRRVPNRRKDYAIEFGPDGTKRRRTGFSYDDSGRLNHTIVSVYNVSGREVSEEVRETDGRLFRRSETEWTTSEDGSTSVTRHYDAEGALTMVQVDLWDPLGRCTDARQYDAAGSLVWWRQWEYLDGDGLHYRESLRGQIVEEWTMYPDPRNPERARVTWQRRRR
jgi:hypothetical protein